MVIQYRTEFKDSKPALVREKVYADIENTADSSEKIVDFVNDIFHLNRLTEEHIYLICLNTKLRITGVFQVGHGLLDEALVNPREIFMKALLLNPYGIILAHNHPSEDPSPSTNDRDFCNRIQQCCKLLGINLLDFIIVGGSYHCSFRDLGLLTVTE